jgi:hypothetical protein
MTYIEFLTDYAYKLAIPFQTKFQFDKNCYSSRKEFYTVATIDVLLFVLLLSLLF